MPRSFSLLPSTPYHHLTRTATDSRGRFAVRVRPPKKSIGFNIMVIDVSRQKMIDPKLKITSTPHPSFDIVPEKWNLIVVP
jgi:hypothetical protein